MLLLVNLKDAYEQGGVFDLLHNPIVAEALQGEPERQRSQLSHRLA